MKNVLGVCVAILIATIPVRAAAQACLTTERAVTCVRLSASYQRTKVFYFSKRVDFSHEFTNDCEDDARLVVRLSGGDRVYNLKSKVEAKGDEDSESSTLTLGRARDDDQASNHVVVTCDDCRSKPSFRACVMRPAQPPPSPPRPQIVTAAPPTSTAATSPVATAAPPTVVVPPPVAVAPPPPVAFALRANLDAIGDDIERLNSASQDSCLDACRRRSDCNAFTFDRWNGVCFLKSGSFATRLEPKAIAGFKNGRVPEMQAGERKIDKFPNRVLRGPTLSTLDATSLDLCNSSCHNDQQCVGFSYSKTTRQCRKLSQVENHFLDPEMASGVKRQ